MTAFETGWEPDPQIVDAVLDGRASLTTLDDADRAVVVAELSERGESVEQIADRLGCCTRVVKRVRAQPLTRTLVRAMRAEAERQAAENITHHARTVGATEQAAQARRAEQLAAQVDALVESTRRLRQELATARSAQRPVTMWVYRRKPGPRQAEQQMPPLFDVDGQVTSRG